MKPTVFEYEIAFFLFQFKYILSVNKKVIIYKKNFE